MSDELVRCDDCGALTYESAWGTGLLDHGCSGRQRTRLKALLDQGRQIVWASEHDHSDGERLRQYGTKHVWLAEVSVALGDDPPQFVDERYTPECTPVYPREESE